MRLHHVPLILLAFLLSTLGGRSAAAQGCDASPLLIRNVNVWTPEGTICVQAPAATLCCIAGMSKKARSTWAVWSPSDAAACSCETAVKSFL